MRKNRTAKLVSGGALLAIIAALGITAYQVGKTGGNDSSQEVLPLESTQESQTAKADEPSEEAGTSQVEADMSAMDGEDLLAGIEADGTSGTGISGTDSTLLDTASDAGNIGTEGADSTGGIISDMESLDASADGLTGVDMASTADTVASVYTAPEINFSEDTLMEWPVHGNILIDYSMDQTTYFPTLDQYKLNPAIVVQAVEGAPVVSAVNGTVFSIEDNAQTGTTVTMELGNGYQAIYGQLTDISVSEGDTVTKGTTIGYIGEPTIYYSEEGNNLYFAMKKDGKPIDPIAYLP